MRQIEHVVLLGIKHSYQQQPRRGRTAAYSFTGAATKSSPRYDALLHAVIVNAFRLC